MAFEYKPFINPYIGSISELMGKGDEAKAAALIRIGEIQARAAEQQGQAWGNAIQGLGNIASKTITDYNDPKLKMEKMALAQAEEDRKNEVRLGELMKRQEASTSTRVVDGAPVIASVDPRDMVSRQTLAQTPELSSRVPSTSFGKPFDVSNGGMARVGTTSPSLVSTTTSKGLYEDENGFFNYKKAHQDLINGGASPASAARVLKSGQDANTAFSAYAAQTKAFAAAKTDMFGNAANTILKALEASPTLTVQAGIQQMLPMLRRQLPEAEYASLQQQVLGMPEAEARQALTGLVDAMDAQNTKTEVSGTSRLVSKSGNVFLPAVPVTKPVDLQKASFGILGADGKVTNVEGSFDPSTGNHYYNGQRVLNPVNVSTATPATNTQEMFDVSGQGYISLTVERGKPGEPTRYYLETPTGRVEKFAGKDFKGRPQASNSNADVSPTALLNATMSLRTQVARETNASKEADIQLANMEASLKAVKDGSVAAGSQGVLVTFQKILDDLSVVRESEYARSASGLSLFSKLQGAYDKIVKGGAGVPVADLEQFVELARQFAKNQKNATAQTMESVSSIVEQYKINPKSVFGNIAPTPKTVSMKAPDGRELDVPLADVERLKLRGAREN